MLGTKRQMGDELRAGAGRELRHRTDTAVIETEPQTHFKGSDGEMDSAGKEAERGRAGGDMVGGGGRCQWEGDR